MEISSLSQMLGTETPLVAIVIRLSAACVFGFLIGLDREVRGRPAGLRTHMLVSLAAAMFTLVSIEIVARNEDVEVAQIDPLRVVEAITAGVAFLAAGTIIQARGKIRGLTTGAGMWLAGAIGLSCGAGLLTLALIGTLLVLVILRPMYMLERFFGRDDKSCQEPPAELQRSSGKENF